MQVQAYLQFDGRCDEAIQFYKEKLGAEVSTLMRFKDMPGGPQPGMCGPADVDKVMHSELRIGDSTVMASDGRCTGNPKFDGFSLTLDARSDADAQKLFAALSDGGTVCMPLMKTFFSSSFGMVNDRFGVPWMVVVQQPR